MATSHRIQRSFSGGEVSSRVALRDDLEAFGKSCLAMINYIPTMMGGVERTQGTRHIRIIDDDTARIVPFIAPDNKRHILIMTPGIITMVEAEQPEIIAQVGSTQVMASTTDGPTTQNTVVYRKPLIPESEAELQVQGEWSIEPGRGANDTGGWHEGGDADRIRMVPRLYKNGSDPSLITVKRDFVVDEPTNVLTLITHLHFLQEIPVPSGYTVVIKVNVKGGANLYNESLQDERAGYTWIIERNIDLPTADWTGTCEVVVTHEAIPASNEGEKYSTPTITLNRCQVWGDGVAEIIETEVETPFTEEDLPFVHFVQSPYDDKEMVFTHYNYPPQRFYFDAAGTAEYICEDIPFENPPVEWGEKNYPRTCTSFMGRLILAGGRDEYEFGTPLSPTQETVWGTMVGEWTKFSPFDEVDPNDSIEFTAIYRSPIQWVHGHKTLLVGALEMEYVANADGIFAPGDLGVNLHSTNGGIAVQPAGMGESVIFAADGGNRARMMSYSNDQQGWVASDLTALHSDLCKTGIKRMIRVRNPHQMTFALLGSGEIAVLHLEGPLSGWSRLNFTNGQVVDICVIANNAGIDVPYVIVRRDNAAGTKTLYLEAFPNWTTNTKWDYMFSSRLDNNIAGRPAPNIIPNLGHLEGKQVQVVADSSYLGTFQVEDSQVVLEDQIGNPIEPVWVVVGQAMYSRLRTLPPAKTDPGAQSRYNKFSVRVLGSTKPIINGDRPADRSPQTAMGQSEYLEIINDHQITDMGWDAYSTILIEEDVPLRQEIVGIYGKLAANSL